MQLNCTRIGERKVNQWSLLISERFFRKRKARIVQIFKNFFKIMIIVVLRLWKVGVRELCGDECLP